MLLFLSSVAPSLSCRRLAVSPLMKGAVASFSPARLMSSEQSKAGRAEEVEEEDREVSFLESSLLKVAKWYRRSMGYHKYGLRKEDILIENADIAEALNRLPEEVRRDRDFRFKRAFDASGHNDYLPERAWLSQEEADKPYLQDTLDEVLEERRERAEYDRA